MNEEGNPIYQLKVTLKEIDPPVWRRLQVYQHITFDQLHLTLQAALGWLNYHLYQFQIGDLTISDDETIEELGSWGDEFSGVSSYDARLATCVQEPGTTFTYEYDFGDSWEHELVLEQKLPLEAGRRYPHCLDGARSRPPEDVGGIWGYRHFLEAIADPGDPEHDEYLHWVGGSFDPEAFSAAEVNRRFREGYIWYDQWVVDPLATTPYFTRPAEELWQAVPESARADILANAWCSRCRRPRQMIDYRGRVQKGRVLLEGHCVACGLKVARLLEG